MDDPRTLTSKQLQSYILQCLKERLDLHEASIVRSDTLVFGGKVDGVFSGYFVEIYSKYGEKTVDAGVRIYWDRFSRTHEQISLAAPYENTPPKKWEMSAIFVGLDKLNEDWPNGGMIARDAKGLADLVGKMCSMLEDSATKFLNKYASIEGMFQYLEDAGQSAPGTWRPTLEFLLREKLFGSGDACQNLQSSCAQQPTGYERHQKSWLLEHGCGQALQLHDIG